MVKFAKKDPWTIWASILPRLRAQSWNQTRNSNTFISSRESTMFRSFISINLPHRARNTLFRLPKLWKVMANFMILRKAWLERYAATFTTSNEWETSSSSPSGQILLKTRDDSYLKFHQERLKLSNCQKRKNKWTLSLFLNHRLSKLAQNRCRFLLIKWCSILTLLLKTTWRSFRWRCTNFDTTEEETAPEMPKLLWANSNLTNMPNLSNSLSPMGTTRPSSKRRSRSS